MRRSPRPRAGAATSGGLVAATAALLLGGLVGSAAGSTAVPEDPTPTTSPTGSPGAAEDETDPAEDPVEDPPEAPATGPLRVVLHRLQPAALPERPEDEVTVAGTVRNRSEAAWSDLKAYLLTSERPLTSAAELAAAVRSDPTTEVGERIIKPGLYDELPDLDPGEATGFRLSVPRSAFEVSGESGVYWLGVHVLGTSGGERDVAADGRARTFLPLVPRGTPGTALAVAAQFRSRLVRQPDGRLAYPGVVGRRFSRTGRLQRLVALSGTAQQGQLSWVVDPAVLEAAGSLADGNPPSDVEPEALPGAAGEQGADGRTDGGVGDDDGAQDTDDAAGPDGAPGARDPGARRAARWLTDFSAEARRHEVLALPYGDLDVAAAYGDARAALSTHALEVSDRLLDTLGIGSQPVVAPPSGHLPANALTALSPDVLTVLSPAAAPTSPRPLVETSTGTAALLAGPAESTHGPGPGASRAALAVRQRLLAEGALHALSADRSQPMLALLPAWWDPGPGWRAARFVGGLSQRWLELVQVQDVRRDARPSPLLLPEGLTYPEEEEAAELPASVLEETDDLITQGATYESVFVEVGSVGDRLARQALLSASVWNRGRPALAADRARSAADLVQTVLGEIEVRSPPFVTLSSEDGDFLVTLANGLGERVRVGLRASVSGPGLQLSTPTTITLEPNERRSVRIPARSTGLGIHRVTLQPTTESGLPLGTPATLSVRTSSVGLFLWIIMAGGAAVLFGAIAVRIVRRMRRRSDTSEPLLPEDADRQPEGAA